MSPYVPSTCAAILCAGIAIGNAIQHHWGWAAFDGALVLVNLGVLVLVARSRRKMRKQLEDLDHFLRGRA